MEIKGLTGRDRLAIPEEDTIRQINGVVRGWVGYFYYGHCSQDLSALRLYLEERVRRYLIKRHKKRGRGYKAYPSNYLYGSLGLYKIPVIVPWTQIEEDDWKAVFGKTERMV